MNNEYINFGCRLNIYESELIKLATSKAGLTDSIIFNSCSVTKEAERQLRQSIRKKKKQNPTKRIIVTGCAAQINSDFYQKMSEVDYVMGNLEKVDSDAFKLVREDIKTNLVKDIFSRSEIQREVVTNFDKKCRAYIEVQNGCDHRCTYCVIPYARGNNISIPFGNIVKQAQLIVEQGYNEIVLTGVDITNYGSDLPGYPKLGNIVTRLLKLCPDLQRLRLSSIDVAEIDEELLELMKYESRLMPHFHISVQSGDDMILKRMKRRHKRHDVIEFCNTISEVRPNSCFGADFIAGFPTETDEMHQNTCNLIKEAGLSLLHVFPYSERPNTPAAKIPLDRQISIYDRKQRAKEIRAIGRNNLNKYLQQFENKKLNVLIESDMIGKTEEFIKVSLTDSYPVGEVKRLQIKDVYDDYLLA
jgi:threonylcarbamoyladenosine tRNA methylthiotransferase MtaB